MKTLIYTIKVKYSFYNDLPKVSTKDTVYIGIQDNNFISQ